MRGGHFGIALIFCALAGCASPPPAPKPDPGAKEQRPGIVRWEFQGKTYSSDIIFSRASDGVLSLAVAPSGEKPLLALSADRDQWSGSGRLCGRTWTGPAAEAPVQLWGWIALARAYLTASAQPDGTGSIITSSYRMAFTKKDGVLRALSVESFDSSERFDFRFSD